MVYYYYIGKTFGEKEVIVKKGRGIIKSVKSLTCNFFERGYGKGLAINVL